MKICKCCKKELPFSDFYKSTKAKDGYRGKCKTCYCQETNAYYHKNPDKYRKYKGVKITLAERREQNMRLYGQLTKPYKDKRIRPYDEKRKEICKRYYLNNKEKSLESGRRWANNNPEKIREKTARRRAARKNAIPSWYGELDVFVIKEAELLRIKREELTGVKWHIDHVVPLQNSKVCGLHCAYNLAVIPAVENQRKLNSFDPDGKHCD